MMSFATDFLQCTFESKCVIPLLFTLVKSDAVAFSAFVGIPIAIIVIIVIWIIWRVCSPDNIHNTLEIHIKNLCCRFTSFFTKQFIVVSLTFITVIFPLLSAFFVFLAEAHDKRIDRASAVVAQAENFLRKQYSSQNMPKKDEYKDTLYYGSATDLKGSLEFLFENKRKLTYLYLPKTELGLIEIPKATLRFINFSHAYLNKANFSQADLAKANLIGSKLSKAKLNRADLYEAKFNRANMEKAILKGAVITATDFTDARNLTKEQIMGTCWLRPGTYIVDGEEIVIKDKDAKPPILPDYLKDFNVHSLPKAKLADKRGDIAYCP